LRGLRCSSLPIVSASAFQFPLMATGVPEGQLVPHNFVRSLTVTN
jgi:hypothetical protein